MENALNGLLGLAMILSWIYMQITQFKSAYQERSTFEKFVTWFAMVSFWLFVIGSMSVRYNMESFCRQIFHVSSRVVL